MSKQNRFQKNTNTSQWRKPHRDTGRLHLKTQKERACSHKVSQGGATSGCRKQQVREDTTGETGQYLSIYVWELEQLGNLYREGDKVVHLRKSTRLILSLDVNIILPLDLKMMNQSLKISLLWGRQRSFVLATTQWWLKRTQCVIRRGYCIGDIWINDCPCYWCPGRLHWAGKMVLVADWK